VFASWLLGEVLTSSDLVGAGCILTACVLNEVGRKTELKKVIDSDIEKFERKP